MHLVQKFWNHLRNTDGDTIAFSLFLGFTILLLAVIVVSIMWGLIEWLGVFVVLVPFVIIIAFLIVYGIGRFVIEKFDL